MTEPSEYCCGGTCLRALCDFHRPEPSTERSAPNPNRKELHPDGETVLIYRDGVLVDEEPWYPGYDMS